VNGTDHHKAHIKSCSSPLVQTRADDPQDRSLLVLAVWKMSLATVAALIFRMHTDDITEDPGFCKHSINVCVCGLCLNITSLILFELVLPNMRVGGGFTCDPKGHFIFFS